MRRFESLRTAAGLEANRENRFDCKLAPAKAKVQSERQEPAQWEG